MARTERTVYGLIPARDVGKGRASRVIAMRKELAIIRATWKRGELLRLFSCTWTYLGVTLSHGDWRVRLRRHKDGRLREILEISTDAFMSAQRLVTFNDTPTTTFAEIAEQLLQYDL